jgi:hypothetical protein
MRGPARRLRPSFDANPAGDAIATSDSPGTSPGVRATSSMAASRSAASNSRQPPKRLLNGDESPSVVSVLPSYTRVVVAVSAGLSASPDVTPGFG